MRKRHISVALLFAHLMGMSTFADVKYVWFVGDSRVTKSYGDDLVERSLQYFHFYSGSDELEGTTLKPIGTEDGFTRSGRTGQTTLDLIKPCKWFDAANLLSTLHSSGVKLSDFAAYAGKNEDTYLLPKAVWMLDMIKGKFNDQLNKHFPTTVGTFGPDKVPSLVVVMLGTNDLRHIYKEQLQELGYNSHTKKVCASAGWATLNTEHLCAIIGGWYKNNVLWMDNMPNGRPRIHVVNPTPLYAGLNSPYNEGAEVARDMLLYRLRHRNIYYGWLIDYYLSEDCELKWANWMSVSNGWNVEVHGIDLYGWFARFLPYESWMDLEDGYGVHLNSTGNFWAGMFIGARLASETSYYDTYNDGTSDAGFYGRDHERFDSYTDYDGVLK